MHTHELARPCEGVMVVRALHKEFPMRSFLNLADCGTLPLRIAILRSNNQPITKVLCNVTLDGYRSRRKSHHHWLMSCHDPEDG